MNFRAEQIAYLAAHAAHDAAYKAYRAECKTTGAVETTDMTDEECEQVWARDEEIRAKHDVDMLSTARIEAERELIVWALAHMNHIAPEHRATFEYLNANKGRSPKVWNRLVDMACQMAVAE